MTGPDVLVVQVSDLHVGVDWAGLDPDEHRRRLAAGLAAAVAQVPAPALVVASGDLTDHGRPDEVATLSELLAGVDRPLLVMPGNHDDRDALVAAGLAVPDAATGHLDAVVDLGGLRVVALDTLWSGHPAGRLDAAQLAWLDDRLAEDPRPVLLALHHPPVAVGHAEMDPMGLAEPEALGAVLDRHDQVVRITCGHVHRTTFSTWRGIGVVTAPSLTVQLAPAFGGTPGLGLTAEPPGYVVHRWHPADGLSSHVFALA